jgi:hypothetical protein
MRPSCRMALGVLILWGVGCESEPRHPGAAVKPSSGAKATKSNPVGITSARGSRRSTKAFLDQKKQVPPHLEWTRQMTSRNGGTISFRVTSQGPFAVTVVTDQALKALRSGNQKALNKSDILLMTDSTPTTYAGKVTVPPGSSWFIIENQTDKAVEFHLECFSAN